MAIRYAELFPGRVIRGFVLSFEGVADTTAILRVTQGLATGQRGEVMRYVTDLSSFLAQANHASGDTLQQNISAYANGTFHVFLSPAATMTATQELDDDFNTYGVLEFRQDPTLADTVQIPDRLTGSPATVRKGVRLGTVTMTGGLISSVDNSTKEVADPRFDAAEQGIDGDAKPSVRCATTESIDLASSSETMDGETLVLGDRVLVKNQTTVSQNGIYEVVRVVGGLVKMSRTSDADSAYRLTPGMLVIVEEGTANADTIWKLISDAPLTLGDSNIVFDKHKSLDDLVAGAGLTRTGDTLDVGAGLGVTVNANDVAVNYAIPSQAQACQSVASQGAANTAIRTDGQLSFAVAIAGDIKDVGTVAGAGVSAKFADAGHVHALAFPIVNSVLGTANASIGINAQKITNAGQGTAAGEVLTAGRKVISGAGLVAVVAEELTADRTIDVGDVNKGVQVNANDLQVDASEIAGAGLIQTVGVGNEHLLAVGAGTDIVVAADTVSVATTTATRWPISTYRLAADSTLTGPVLETEHTAITFTIPDLNDANRRTIRFRAVLYMDTDDNPNTWRTRLYMNGPTGILLADTSTVDMSLDDAIVIDGEVQIRAIGAGGAFSAQVRVWDEASGSYILTQTRAANLSTLAPYSLILTGLSTSALQAVTLESFWAEVWKE